MASLTQWTWVWVTSRSCDGQGGLECCSPWGRKESDMTERLNWELQVFLNQENSSVPYVPDKTNPPLVLQTTTGKRGVRRGLESTKWSEQDHVLPASELIPSLITKEWRGLPQNTSGKILKPSHFSPSQFHYHYLLENMRTNQSHQTCTSVHVNHHMEPRASWLYFIPLVSNLLWLWVQWDNIPSPSLLFLPIKHVPFWYIKYISENIE